MTQSKGRQKMKHAEITTQAGPADKTKIIEAGSGTGLTVFLSEKEYSQQELDLFNSISPSWILKRSGHKYFLADSDSGEDAEGWYCGYFDLEPSNAVFENGEFVGFYLCAGDFRYSGLSRSSFSVEAWGYPGDDPFKFISYGHRTHLFLFSDAETHRWNDWSLLVRDPDRQYNSYIDF